MWKLSNQSIIYFSINYLPLVMKTEHLIDIVYNSKVSSFGILWKPWQKFPYHILELFAFLAQFFMSVLANVHWWMMNVCKFRYTRLARMCFNVNLKFGFQMVILPLKCHTAESLLSNIFWKIQNFNFWFYYSQCFFIQHCAHGIFWELAERTCTELALEQV